MKQLLVLVLLAACGKGGDKPADDRVASCNMEGAQSCREYRGGNLALGSDSLVKLCTVVVSSAKFTMTACPTAKVIATCAKSEGKDFYYEGYVSSPAEIEKQCTDGGGKFSK